MTSCDLKIYNAGIVTPGGIIDRGTLCVDKGKIVLIEKGSVEVEAGESIDAGGRLLSPGFIDIHIHGGGGHDFMDGTVEAFLGIAELHARYGTTAMTPTSLSSDIKDLRTMLETYEQAHGQNHHGAQFVGMHVEGPYIAMSQKGAQDPRYIRNPDPAEYRELIERFPFIKRWSAAPELPGAHELGRYMASKGVLPAIAHTDAIYEEVLEAFHAGYTHMTHFYSAMSTVSRRDAYRYAGTVEAGYLIDDMTVEIIVDGVHLPAPLLQLVCKVKGIDKVTLITDAMRAAGMPPGKSFLGPIGSGMDVIVEDGVAKLPDRSAFAGSVATCDRLVRNMIRLAGVTPEEAITMMTINPARITGIDDHKGSLEPGKDADLVLLDDQYEVLRTIVNGRTIYAAGGNSQTNQ